jgi:cell division protein FtsB
MAYGKLKKAGIIAAVALVPLLFCANVWQSFRYSSLKREIARLEAVQQDLLEQNKRNIAGISVLESPQRIDELGREELGLSRPAPDTFIMIRPPQKEEGAHDE